MKIEKIRSFFYLFFLLLLLWLFLTSSLKFGEILTGISISLILTVFLNKQYSNLGFPPVTPKRILFSAVYVFVLFKEIVKANFDVAYRVIHPRMPIKPGIVVIETKLKSGLAKLILANSITLTPGTFTLDIIDDKFLIHWINVKAEDVKGATKIIGEKFEKYLEVIFKAE